MENNNGIIERTVGDLKGLIEQNLNVQMGVIPVYKEISNRILEMFNRDEELANWEAKDLIKLLDLSNKAQIAPIEQITKLVQSITALYERSQLQEKIDNMSEVVKKFQESKSLDNSNYEEIEEV